MAGALLLGASNALQNAVAEGDTRTLSFHHVHTGEDITVTFKRDGRYDDAALKKLDWFMRDWRKEKDTHMDPHIFDLLWEVYRDVERHAADPDHLRLSLAGHQRDAARALERRRAPQPAPQRPGDRLLYSRRSARDDPRRRSASCSAAASASIRRQDRPFVHMDTGLIRHWPRIPREELARIFPDGRTVHIPSDGKPLRNYALALADVERHGNAPNSVSLAAARGAGVISDTQEQQAELAQANAQEEPRKRSLFARLFGGRKDEDELSEQPAPRQARDPARAPARTPVQVASVALAKPVPVATKRIVPLPAARPTTVIMAAAKRKAAEPIVTASVSARMVESRNIWGDVIKTPAPFEVASAEPATTGADAMAYAAESQPAQAVRARPMGERVPRLAREATVMPGTANTTIAVKAPDMSIGGQRSDSPWLRAAMLTPSVSGFMTSTRLGELSPAWLQELLHKPEQSVLMSFSADPQLGMMTDRFTGNAVVFLATATFTTQTTASLRWRAYCTIPSACI